MAGISAGPQRVVVPKRSALEIARSRPCNVCDEGQVRASDRAWMVDHKNAEGGRPAFVIGNGTSLRDITDEQWGHMRQAVTFGCNYLLSWERLQRHRLDFIPSYYCASEEDHLGAIDRLVSGIPFAAMPRVFAKNRFKRVEYAQYDWIRVHTHSGMLVEDGYIGGLGVDRGYVHFAYTAASVVLDCALQLAVWLGCDPIYLVGVDADGGGHAYDDPASTAPEGTAAAPLHANGQWRERLIVTAKACADLLRPAGIRVCVVGDRSQLTLRRVSLEQALEGVQ